MGQINTNNYPTVDSLADADLLIVENAAHGTGTTTPKQLRENAIGTDPLQTSAQTVTGAVNELKNAIDAGSDVKNYDIDTISSGYLGEFDGKAKILLLHLTADGTADATNGYTMLLSYTRPVARLLYGQLVDSEGVAYKQDVYAENTIICAVTNSGTGTEADPQQVVILGITNTGFTLTPTAVVSDRDIIDGQGNTLSVLAEALTKTASGNPVVITDCAGGKARSLKTTIEAIQDLHGYDHPWVGGAYKNKLPYDLATMKSLNTDGTWSDNVYTDGGVSFTVADGVVYLSGTATKLVMFYIAPNIDDALVADASYILTGAIDGNIQVGISQKGFDSGSGLTFVNSFTISDPSVRINIASGVNTNGKVVKPMIRLSTESDASFAPYSNICPISGYDSVSVERTGKNLLEAIEQGAYGAIGDDAESTTRVRSAVISVNEGESYTFSMKSSLQMYVAWWSQIGTTYISQSGWVNMPYTATAPVGAKYMRIMYRYANDATITPSNVVDAQIEKGTTPTAYEPYSKETATIQLGQTVYGAEVDFDTGVVSVTDGYIASYDGETLPSTWISDRDVYAEGTTPSTGAEVVYTLATPTTLQLTPAQLEMLKGYNRVTIEAGEIELGYIAKLT